MWIDLNNIVDTTGKMKNIAYGTILFKFLSHTQRPQYYILVMKIHVCTNMKNNDWTTYTTLTAVVGTEEKERNKIEVQEYFSIF